LLFVLASFPLGLFDATTLLVLFGLGGLGYALLAIRERGTGLRSALAFLRSTPGMAVAGGSLALLALEVVSGQVLLPNGVDGTVYSLFVNVLIRNGGVSWTLQPYATTGILYPQGAPVWMAVPVLLFHWPIVAAPVELPPLFLSFTVPAGYCLGLRLQPRLGLGASHAGLLFAAFFGLLASWPRLYVAGSYDFIFALPMFLVALGLLATYTDRDRRPWGEVLAIGVLFGALASISGAIGTALLVLLIAYVLAALVRHPERSWGSELARVGALAGVTVAFVARSVAGLALWYGYPGHVLTQTGSPPYAPLATTVVYAGWTTQLDPFLPWKPKISPIPILYLVLEALFVIGIALVVIGLASRKHRAALAPAAPFGAWVLVGVAALVIEISAVLEAVSVNPSVSGLQQITNAWETSFLLFTLYSLIALVPLTVALSRMVPLRSRPPGTSTGTRGIGASGPIRAPGPDAASTGRYRGALAVAVALPLVIGGVGTAAYVPGYIQGAIVAEANATTADLEALQWSGTHLPSCSRVLVAPGSAAQFLPEFAEIHLVFPVYPSPTNRSYTYLVTNLTAGIWSNGTRTAMLELGITEVFATGATTNAYRPFDVAPLLASPEFTSLFDAQDAVILGFSPGIAGQGCPPVAPDPAAG
jgi:hypothetical protein